MIQASREQLVVMWLMSDDFNIVKIHLMMTFLDMIHNFRVRIEHQDGLFVLGNSRLKWSFSLAIEKEWVSGKHLNFSSTMSSPDYNYSIFKRGGFKLMYNRIKFDE